MRTLTGPPMADGRPQWVAQIGEGGSASANPGRIVSWLYGGSCRLAPNGRHLLPIRVYEGPGIKVTSAPGLPPETKTEPCWCNWLEEMA